MQRYPLPEILKALPTSYEKESTLQNLHATDWIALCSAVGTFLSSLFVLFTLLELRTQRKQSYMPALVMPDVCFYYNNDQETYIKMWETDDIEMLNIKVHNIGLGVAKDIDFTWYFDIDTMMRIFHCLSESDESELYVDSEKNRIHHSKHGKMLNGSSLSADSTHSDFLLPYGVNRETIELKLPNSYICISTAIFKNAFISELFDLDEFEKSLCPLVLTAKYKDVGGSDIEKKFNIKVCFFIKSINSRLPASPKVIKMRGRVYVSDI